MSKKTTSTSTVSSTATASSSSGRTPEEEKAILDQLQELQKNFQYRNTWVVFIGAGASKNAGVPTMIELCDDLVKETTAKKDDKEKLIQDIYFYCDTRAKTENRKVNIENILEELLRIDWVVSGKTGVTLGLPTVKDVTEILINESIKKVKDFVLSKIMITSSNNDYKEFIKYWFGGTKQLDIFTTNWDILIESACDDLLNEPTLYLKINIGTRGMLNKKLDFDSYTEDTKLASGDIQLLNLYKLHGSLDWRLHNSEVWIFKDETKYKDSPVMIFPTPAKSKETLGYPYADLFRILNDKLSDTEHCKYILAIGCSFPDEHINNIIKQAFKRKKDDFNLYVIDPMLKREQLIKIFGEYTNIREPINIKFNEFVNYLLKGVLS
jgi:NAD-dependent SIR2 family protein deacetylase